MLVPPPKRKVLFKGHSPDLYVIATSNTPASLKELWISMIVFKRLLFLD